MSLRRFLHESIDDILAEWEKESGLPAAGLTARRLHFGQVLRAVADEMNRMSASAATASAAAAATLAEDAPRRAGGGEPSHSHAGQLVDDYASLRASVLRQWRQKHPSPSAADLDELVHFNEAMDRSLAELSATFSPSQSQPNALFLGVLNHELRTLVASILMSGQVLTHRRAGVSENLLNRAEPLTFVDRALGADEVARAVHGVVVADDEAHAPVEDEEALAAEVVAVARRAVPGRRDRLDRLHLLARGAQHEQASERPKRLGRVGGGRGAVRHRIGHRISHSGRSGFVRLQSHYETPVSFCQCHGNARRSGPAAR